MTQNDGKEYTIMLDMCKADKRSGMRHMENLHGFLLIFSKK